MSSSYDATQNFKGATSLRNFSAALGSSQKPASCSFSAASFTLSRLDSMSKTPPQRQYALLQGSDFFI